MEQHPSIGRFVHYTLADGQCRPATIVRVWGSDQEPGESVNLVVVVDGSNDNRMHEGQFMVPEASAQQLCIWRTSVRRSEGPEPGHWHWPERI